MSQKDKVQQGFSEALTPGWRCGEGVVESLQHLTGKHSELIGKLIAILVAKGALTQNELLDLLDCRFEILE